MHVLKCYRWDYKGTESKKFNEQLEHIIAKVPKKDILIIQGDKNAKFRPEAYQSGTARHRKDKQHRAETS
ncbi:hypothetical protein DPMN_120961 [Dreissena polymorpha]|uniref:Uncharacterized protein n=1 Tax=Dreissena polymorpha TaxID=45954 RepID=A0A9D4GSM6_DREPO|nr:hypothetical protein DPMN_120961 [Dreissena polymorpha]